MTVTVAQIKVEFPEFLDTDSVLIDRKLGDARQMLNGAAFGGMYDQAVKYLACHLIALSPHGEQARLVESQEPGGATTTYERHFMRIVHGAVAGPMAV